MNAPPARSKYFRWLDFVFAVVVGLAVLVGIALVAGGGDIFGIAIAVGAVLDRTSFAAATACAPTIPAGLLG